MEYFPNCAYTLIGLAKNKNGKVCAVIQLLCKFQLRTTEAVKLVVHTACDYLVNSNYVRLIRVIIYISKNKAELCTIKIGLYSHE